MHFTELDLEFSRMSYDQFITAYSDLGFSTTSLFFNFICLFCFKFVNVYGNSTINDGGLTLNLSIIVLIIVN